MKKLLKLLLSTALMSSIVPTVPSHIPGELKKALDKADVKHELKVFPGTQHGFCFPERAVYDTLAAEETWSKIFAMWDRRLK
jgi:carboxymethylenebutenolidase